MRKKLAILGYVITTALFLTVMDGVLGLHFKGSTFSYVIHQTATMMIGIAFWDLVLLGDK